MGNVAGLAVDAIRKAFPAAAQQIIVEKPVEGAAVRYQLGQLLIARNANRGVRLGVGVDHQNIRLFRRESFRQCDDGGSLSDAAFHVCDSNKFSSHAALLRDDT